MLAPCNSAAAAQVSIRYGNSSPATAKLSLLGQ
jgi:hypothetical protein